MLVFSKRRYKKLYVVGRAGFLDTIYGFFKRLFTSNAAKQMASTALSVGKDAARQIGKHALDTGKIAAINAGKRLVDKVADKLFTPKITQKSKEILASLIDDDVNMKNLLSESSGVKAIAMQDLVRRLNGGGLKIA